MKPKWEKLANLAQEICTLLFSSLLKSLLLKDTLLRTYFSSYGPLFMKIHRFK